MPDYDKIADNALESIQRNGRAVIITRGAVAIDPITGIPTGATEETGTLQCLVLARYTGPVQNQMDDAFRADLLKGEAKMLTAAAKGAAFTPAVTDVVTIDGVDWRAVGVSELAPDGTPLLYYIGVKKV